ncbi:MAG TPA: molybdenum cofactor biosynthesis protein MoaE [Acidobacteriaceae bacterium]|jgi:molybdopterin synthase catalytic subunit|nr:molybdenum cofactor biosynthesis protein MoaE [Acidobacteriaceae bacterium]
MRITLLAFGILHDHFPSAGPVGLPLDLPDGATVASLLDHCRALAPNGGLLWSSLAVAVNREYAHAAQPLADGDEVALLPPVSGGAGDEDSTPAPDVRLVHERILARDIVPPLELPADGAVVIFDGIVRNHSRGRTTRYLEYEAYEPMALAQMQDLARQALTRFPIRNVALVHRLGRLAIGESSVLIAVFSAHRAAAFDACRFLIDTLKQIVPIWKKEIFTDGAIWAQGEPFPAELTPTALTPELEK